MKRLAIALPIILVSVVSCISTPMPPPHTPSATTTVQVVLPTAITLTAIPIGTAVPTLPVSPPMTPIITTTPTGEANFLSFQIADLAFVDALHGWALGQYRNANNIGNIAMRMTLDGGRTWRLIPAPETRIVFGGPSATKIRFANARDGWAFDPGLFSTHDGGQTWADERLQGDVIAVEPAGGTVWAIERTCKDALTHNDCQFTLLLSDQRGQSWRPSTTELPSTVWRLVRVSDKEAWLLSTDSYWIGNVTRQRVWVTRDGGQTWSEPDPSASIFGCEHFAIDNSRQLWLLCGGGMATDMEKKWLLTSKDGGKSWARVADDNLPILGGNSDLAVVSNQRAFIALGGFSVFATLDGGHSWKQSIGFSDASAFGAFGRVLFVDELHGWATIAGNVIARTEDGGMTWEQVAIP